MKKVLALILTAMLFCWTVPAVALEPVDDGGSSAPSASASAQVEGAPAGDAAASQSAQAATSGDAAVGDPTTSQSTQADNAADAGGASAEAAAESHTITFLGNGHGFDVVYALEVPKGEVIWDAIRSLDGGIMAWQKKVFFEIEEGDQHYQLVGYSYDIEGNNAVFFQDDFNNQLTHDLTLYGAWRERIDSVEITVQAPLCGSVVNTPKIPNEEYWDFSAQVVSPVIAVPPDALYASFLQGFISGFDEHDMPIALNGVTLEGGKSYELFTSLVGVSGDYYFLTDGLKVTVNGAELKDFSASGSLVQVRAFVTAVHNWSEWVQTVAPTCVSPGEEARHCLAEGCSAEETREVAIDPNAHDWGEWVVTKAATETSEGERVRVCKNDSSHVQREVIPKLAPASKGRTVAQTGDPLLGLVAVPIALVVAAGVCAAVALRGRRES